MAEADQAENIRIQKSDRRGKYSSAWEYVAADIWLFDGAKRKRRKVSPDINEFAYFCVVIRNRMLIPEKIQRAAGPPRSCASGKSGMDRLLVEQCRLVELSKQAQNRQSSIDFYWEVESKVCHSELSDFDLVGLGECLTMSILFCEPLIGMGRNCLTELSFSTSNMVYLTLVQGRLAKFVFRLGGD